jgi:hypothetical protein
LINHSKAQTSVIIAPIPTRHPFAPHLGSFTKLVDRSPFYFYFYFFFIFFFLYVGVVVEETQIPSLFWVDAASLFLSFCYFFLYLIVFLYFVFGQMLLQKFNFMSCFSIKFEDMVGQAKVAFILSYIDRHIWVLSAEEVGDTVLFSALEVGDIVHASHSWTSLLIMQKLLKRCFIYIYIYIYIYIKHMLL